MEIFVQHFSCSFLLEQSFIIIAINISVLPFAVTEVLESERKENKNNRYKEKKNEETFLKENDEAENLT